MAAKSRSNRLASERARIVDRLAALGDHEDVAAQIEKTGQFVAAAERFLRARPRHRRQVARDQAHREEREQRDPVVRIRNGERADWRQEKEIERQDGDERCDYGDPEAGCGGGHEDDDQERHRHRRRIRDAKPPDVDERDGGDANEAESQPPPSL